jgi:hypothetical protein
MNARQRFGLCLGLCLATATLAASKEDAIPFGSPENRPADVKPSAVNMVFTYKRHDTNKDLEILQGTWKVVKSALLDEDYRKYFEEHGKVVIKGSTMTFLVDDPKAKPVRFVEFTIMVDSSKSPGLSISRSIPSMPRRSIFLASTVCRKTRSDSTLGTSARSDRRSSRSLVRES